MTDKQMSEKKKEFMKMAGNGIQASLGVERYGVSIIFEDGYIDLLWQWISKLVEEVEREGYKKGLIDQSIRDITN